MKTLKGTFFALSLFATAAFGTETDTLRVTVPFAFTAGSAILPAGDYVISQQDSQILTIGGKGGSAILMTMPQGQSADPRKSNVTFGRTSKGNTLLEVQMSGRPSVIMHAGK
jgi:hypothetical protein